MHVVDKTYRLTNKAGKTDRRGWGAALNKIAQKGFKSDLSRNLKEVRCRW